MWFRLASDISSAKLNSRRQKSRSPKFLIKIIFNLELYTQTINKIGRQIMSSLKCKNKLTIWRLVWTKGDRKTRKGKYSLKQMMKLTQKSSKKDPRDGTFIKYLPQLD